MAKFNSISRSNYVKVKDVEAAKKSIERFGNTVHLHPVKSEFIMIKGCDTGFATSLFDENGNNEVLYFRNWAQEHLAVGQTLILTYMENEELMHLSAGAEVYTWDGRAIVVDLMSTLQRGLKDIGVQEDQVALPEYTTICTWEPPTPHCNFADF